MEISGYGVMIALGLLAAGAVGRALVRRAGLDINDFILLAVYSLALGVLGAKAAYLLLNAGRIDWSRFFELEYFNALMSGGFIFYGGIPAGLLGLWLAGRVHHISVLPYLRVGVPLIPLCHAFGRVGCYLAGCCFGVPYDGPFAVTYQRAHGAPLGVPLFPVQLLEAALLLVIAGTLLWCCHRGWSAFGLLGVYLAAYGVVRFLLEYLRYDAERGRFLWFSTSQWVSLFLLAVVGLGWLAARRSAAPKGTDAGI